MEQILFGIDVSGIDKALGRELTTALLSDQSRLKKTYSAALADATKKGTEKGLSASKVEEYLGRAFNKGEATLAKAAALYAKAAQTTDTTARKSLEKQADAMRKASDEQAAARMKVQIAIIDKHGKALKQWEEFQDKRLRDRISTMTTGLKDAWSALKTGDVFSLFDSIKGGAGLVSGAGAKGALSVAGGAGGAGGASAGMAAAAGSIAAAAAPLAVAAASIAAVVGSLALVVKLIMDAVGQTKEFNKKLLEGAGAGDFMMGTMNQGVNDFISGMGTARRAATDFVFNVKWGTVAEDLIGIQKAANSAGLTFREMAGDTSRLANGLAGLPGHMDLALRYSKLLGVSAEDVATQMGAWQTDLGLGLKSLEERFSTITKLAMESGFGVKRFYTMVQQATTGVALYNVRIEEAAALLKKTGEVLGESEASDFIQTLQKGFSDEDYPTRLRRVMLTGMEDTRAIVTQSATATGQRLAADFATPLQSAMKDIGMGDMDIGLALSGEGLVEQLGSMGEDQQAALIYSLQQQGAEGQQAARDLQHVISMGQAAQSGSLDALAEGIRHLDMGGKLAMLMDPQILGNDKMITSMTGMEKHILAQTQNLTPQMIEKLGQMQVSLKGQYAQAVASGEFVGDFRDYVQMYGYREAELSGAMSEQEYLAEASVEATRDLGNIMKNGVQYVLEKIFSLLESFYQSFTGMSKEEMGNRDRAARNLEKQYQVTLGTEQATEAALAEARKQSATATTVGAKEKADKEVARLVEQLKTDKAQSSLIRSAISEMSSVGSAGWREGFGERDEKGFEREAMALAARRHGTEGLSEEMQQKSQEGRAQGEAEKRGELGGLMGLSIDAARNMQEKGAASGNLTAMAVGGMLSWAGGVGIENRASSMEADELLAGYAEMTQDQIDAQVEAEKEQKRRDEESQKTEKAVLDEQERLREQFPSLMAQGMIEANISQMLAGAGMEASQENVRKFLGYGGQQEAQAMRAQVQARLGEDASKYGITAAAYLPGVEDFIYRGSGGAGSITPINTADQFFGAKPGGAISDAMGSGGQTVHINIRGGDTQQIYQTVKRAMQAGR